MPIEIALANLSSDERADLLRALGTSVRFEKSLPSRRALGDLGTAIAIITVTAPVLLGFATYLAKLRRVEDFRQEMEVRHPDGRVERIRIRLRKRELSDADPDVVRELGRACKIAPSPDTDVRDDPSDL